MEARWVREDREEGKLELTECYDIGEDHSEAI